MYGITRISNETHFQLYSSTAKYIALHLYTLDRKPWDTFPMEKKENDWHCTLEDLPPNLLYAYTVDAAKGVLLDPYAKEVFNHTTWNGTYNYQPLGVVDAPPPFDWGGVTRPHIPREKLIIYEMHVRGFTEHPSSGVKHPGTFLGMIEKIPYLVDLGINAVELLPIYEFNETEYRRINPETGEQLCNYWGYSTVNFFAPMTRYGTPNDFKALVKALHKNGIEVILDVVYNHTAEMDNDGPTYSFRGIDPYTYYILDGFGHNFHYTGCGNTFNSNHPVVTQLIVDSLSYWATEYHVDGFRFDLAPVLKRSSTGELLENPPLFQKIIEAPSLSDVKLIAEPWDAVNTDLTGTFTPHSRWSEWNGHYRDTIRQHHSGDTRVQQEFEQCLAGSPHIYPQPENSINFITCHDGFTLRDLVTYSEKHNLSNAEENSDGCNANFAWNCGTEGPTEDPAITALRQKQMERFITTLFNSRGIPMIRMGDEYGHTAHGNNNPWCQDNAQNWFLWDQLDKNQELFTRFKNLIHRR